MRAARRLDGVRGERQDPAVRTPRRSGCRRPSGRAHLSRSPFGAARRRHVHAVGELPHLIGNRWTASGLSGGQTPMCPSPPCALIIATSRITPTSTSSSARSGSRRSPVGGTVERRRRHAVEQSGWTSSICSTRYVTSAVHRSTRVERGGRRRDARRTRRRDGSVRGRAGSGREDEPGEGDERSGPEAAIACVRDSRSY